MASSIDETKPAAGSPTTLSVRQNFNNAKSEINGLLRMSEDVVTSVYLAGAYSATFTNAPSLDNGTRITVLASAPCLDNPSISINGSPGKPIVHLDGSSLKANEIIGSNSHYLDLMYNSANTGSWVLMNPAHLTSNTLNLTGDVTGSVTFDTSDSKDLSTTVDPLVAYPVGAVYISVVSTSPETLFGGTWEALDGGLVLQTVNGTAPAAGSNYSSNSRSISIDNMPAHTHKFTTEKMSAHDGNPNQSGTHIVSDTRNPNDAYLFSPTTTLRDKDYLTTEGSGTAFDVQQASHGVYMWVRTQ